VFDFEPKQMTGRLWVNGPSVPDGAGPSAAMDLIGCQSQCHGFGVSSVYVTLE